MWVRANSSPRGPAWDFLVFVPFATLFFLMLPIFFYASLPIGTLQHPDPGMGIFALWTGFTFFLCFPFIYLAERLSIRRVGLSPEVLELVSWRGSRSIRWEDLLPPVPRTTGSWSLEWKTHRDRPRTMAASVPARVVRAVLDHPSRPAWDHLALLRERLELSSKKD